MKCMLHLPIPTVSEAVPSQTVPKELEIIVNLYAMTKSMIGVKL